MQDSQYDMIRRKVERRYKERLGLIIHVVAFVVFNLLFWGMWLLLTPVSQTIEVAGSQSVSSAVPAFPWPIIITLGWSVGLVGHVLNYYFKYGPGAERREDAIEREVEHEMERRQENGYFEKPKRDQQIRLTEDGELETVNDEDEYSRSGEDERRN
jgi:hypothetical protein